MNVNRLLASGIISLGLLQSNFAVSATTPSANGIDHVWFGSFKSGLPRLLFLLGLWLTLLALAIGNWTNAHGIIVLGGYLGLITSILAAITSAKDVISHGIKVSDPNLELVKA